MQLAGSGAATAALDSANSRGASITVEKHHDGHRRRRLRVRRVNIQIQAVFRDVGEQRERIAVLHARVGVPCRVQHARPILRGQPGQNNIQLRLNEKKHAGTVRDSEVQLCPVTAV